MDGGDEPVGADGAVPGHRHLGHVGDIAAVGERHGDAARMAGWQRRPPVGSGGRQLEHRLVAWRLAQQRARSEEHTSELQSQSNLVCRLLLEKKKNKQMSIKTIPVTYDRSS